jgi:hypothetical protein
MFHSLGWGVGGYWDAEVTIIQRMFFIALQARWIPEISI